MAADVIGTRSVWKNSLCVKPNSGAEMVEALVVLNFGAWSTTLPDASITCAKTIMDTLTKLPAAKNGADGIPLSSISCIFLSKFGNCTTPIP